MSRLQADNGTISYDAVEAWLLQHSHTLLRVLPGLLILAGLLLGTVDAEARVGGGQSYSGGSGRSSGSGGGGDATGLILWLLFEHPRIGIPVVTCVIIVGVVRHRAEQARQRTTIHRGPQVRRPTAQKLQSVRERLTTLDPGFSEVLFIDFFQQILATARQRARFGDIDSIKPWFSDEALAQVIGSSPARVAEVIFGSVQMSRLNVHGKRVQLEVVCELNLLGQGPDGASRQWLRQEVWQLERRVGVHSPGPERMRALVCASCGDPSEPGLDGRCPSCNNLRTGGENHWEVSHVRVAMERPLPAVELHLGGGVEPGTRLPTVRDPELAVSKRAFINRHPDFSAKKFDEKVRHIFMELQSAWSDRALERVRAYQTDALFQVHRFWMARYAAGGLVNRLEDVSIQRIEVVRMSRDAWYEAITVRIFASIRDWTERIDSGQLVGGSKTEARVFSEYWTLVRTIGASTKTRPVPEDNAACPSCGAPLDQMNMAGKCGYCGSKITGGDFDWVLSRIEQDEAYKG